MAKVRAARKLKDDVLADLEIQGSLFDANGEILVNTEPANHTPFTSSPLDENVSAIESLDFTAPPAGDPTHGALPTVAVLSGEQIQTMETSEESREQQFLDLLEGISTASSSKAALRISKEVVKLKFATEKSMSDADMAEQAARLSRKEAAYEVVKLMVDAGCDFSAKQLNSGMTALHYAAANDSLDASVAVLDAITPLPDVQRKAVIDATDNDGVTPLATALFYSGRDSTQSEHIAKILLRHDADFLNIKEEGRNTYEALTDLIESLRRTQEADGNITDGKTLQVLNRVWEDMESRRLEVASSQQIAPQEGLTPEIANLLEAAHTLGNMAPDATERQERLDALLAAIDAAGPSINTLIAPEVFRQYVEESDDTLPQKDTFPEIEADRAYRFGLTLVENAELTDALRMTSVLMAVDAQSVFRRQIQENLPQERQDVLVSALAQYVQTSGEERKNINVADPLARKAVVDLLDSVQAGVSARQRADFKSHLNAWMQALLKTDIATTDSVFIKLHEIVDARGQDDEGKAPNRIIKDIKLDHMRRLVQTGASLLERMRSGQEDLLQTSHVMISRLRWMQGSEKRDVYETLQSVTGGAQNAQKDKQALDSLLSKDIHPFFDQITEFLDGMSDDLTDKTYERGKAPFVEGLSQPNTPNLRWALSTSERLHISIRALHEAIATGHSPEEQSNLIAALSDAAEVRKNREEEMARRASPRMVAEAVFAQLKTADEQEKQEVSERLVRAGVGLTRQSAPSQGDAPVLPLADIEMDPRFFASFVKAQSIQDAADSYLALAVAGAVSPHHENVAHEIEQRAASDTNALVATDANDKALRDQILQAGMELANCTPNLTRGQRIVLTHATCHALSDASISPNTEAKFVLQQGEKQTIDAILPAQVLERIQSVRQAVTGRVLPDALTSCARCAYDISDTSGIGKVPHNDAFFLCAGSTATKALVQQQGGKQVTFNIHPQTLWDIRSAGNNILEAKMGTLAPDTSAKPLHLAALEIQKEISEKRTAGSELHQSTEPDTYARRYYATVVSSPASTPDDEWVRLVPTALTHNPLYLAVKEFAPEGHRVDSAAPFWDVPKNTLDSVQGRFSEILHLKVQQGLNPSSINRADGAGFDGKVAVACNRFMEADGSVTRALQEAGADYKESGIHIANYAHVYINPESVGTFKAALTGNLVKRFEQHLPYGVEAEKATWPQWAVCVSEDCRERALGTKAELIEALTTVAQAQAFNYSDELSEVQQGLVEGIKKMDGVEKMLEAAAASTPEARQEEQHARKLLREQGREPIDASEKPMTGYTAADLNLVANETEAQQRELEANARQEYTQERPYEVAATFN